MPVLEAIPGHETAHMVMPDSMMIEGKGTDRNNSLEAVLMTPVVIALVAVVVRSTMLRKFQIEGHQEDGSIRKKLRNKMSMDGLLTTAGTIGEPPSGVMMTIKIAVVCNDKHKTRYGAELPRAIKTEIVMTIGHIGTRMIEDKSLTAVDHHLDNRTTTMIARLLHVVISLQTVLATMEIIVDFLMTEAQLGNLSGAVTAVFSSKDIANMDPIVGTSTMTLVVMTLEGMVKLPHNRIGGTDQDHTIDHPRVVAFVFALIIEITSRVILEMSASMRITIELDCWCTCCFGTASMAFCSATL